VLIGALLFTLVYGTAGFYLLDRHYQVNFNFWGAIAQTLAMFLTLTIKLTISALQETALLLMCPKDGVQLPLENR
jgi:hypothetical protein